MPPMSVSAMILVHAVLGVGAFVAGLLALASTGKLRRHRKVGRVFMVAMGTAVVLAIPAIVARQNLFLTGIGLLVLYHGGVAWRLARLKPPRRMPGRLDRVVHPAAGLGFLAYGAYGVLLLVSGRSMGWVPIVFAGISLVSVMRFHRFSRQGSYERHEWVGMHVGGVAAAFIAAFTAFCVATVPRLMPGIIPNMVLWLGPTAVFTPMFIVLGRRFEEKLAAGADGSRGRASA